MCVKVHTCALKHIPMCCGMCILSALPCRYTKYLYPYECETKGFSHPDDLRALETNRRDMRSQSASKPNSLYSLVCCIMDSGSGV